MSKAVWTKFITDNEGAVAEGASVTVFLSDGITPATIYSDPAGTSKANPFLTPSGGKAEFYADPGIYVIQASKDGKTATWNNEEIGHARRDLDLSDIESASEARNNLGLSPAATTPITDTPTDSTPGKLLKVGDSPQILLFDPLRKSVEDASGGRQTVIYTAKDQPSYMYVLPRFNMEDIPGWTAGTGTHPAFIANGVVQSEIFIGVYQGAEVNGEAVSQPGLYPRVSINYDQARALCQANGAGHDLIGAWDWAAIALWCMANGYQPTGNTNYGRHHNNRFETGIVPNGATLGSDSTGATNTQCGSGPVAWRHDNTPAGIGDLVGNVWEWMAGLKIIDGVAYLAADNGDYTEAQYTNTGFSMPAAVATPFSSLATTAPDIIKQALLMPNGVIDPAGSVWTSLSGERLPVRGGNRSLASAAGLAALGLDFTRTSASSVIGFRPRFRNP